MTKEVLLYTFVITEKQRWCPFSIDVEWVFECELLQYDVSVLHAQWEVKARRQRK